MVFKLTGRIDSNNATQVEEELKMHLADESSGTLELNASELSYDPWGLPYKKCDAAER